MHTVHKASLGRGCGIRRRWWLRPMEIPLFSQHFDIEPGRSDDWFDPVLIRNTRLFLDPFLLFQETQMHGGRPRMTRSSDEEI